MRMHAAPTKRSIQEFTSVEAALDDASTSPMMRLCRRAGHCEKVRTAHALANLPLIAAAMQRGELSYAKVRAITRVACPSTENTLLQYALHGTAEHVERIVRDYQWTSLNLPRTIRAPAGDAR